MFVLLVLLVMPHLCLHVMIPYLGALAESSNLSLNDLLLKGEHGSQFFIEFYSNNVHPIFASGDCSLIIPSVSLGNHRAEM